MQDETTIFKALGELTRLRIIKSLLNGERCACEIPSLIGRTQSNTSMHLSKLVMWGILQSRKDGKKIFYSIKDKRVIKILNTIGGGARK